VTRSFERLVNRIEEAMEDDPLAFEQQDSRAWKKVDERVVAMMDALAGSGIENPLEQMEMVAWGRTFRQDAPVAVQLIARRLLESQIAVSEYRRMKVEVVVERAQSPFARGAFTLHAQENRLETPKEKLDHARSLLLERGLLRKQKRAEA
jgi:hypothetical protein